MAFLLTFFLKHLDKIVVVGLILAVLGFTYVTGRKHERQVWEPKYAALQEANRVAAEEADRARADQEASAKKVTAAVVADYEKQLAERNAALLSALDRLRLASRNRPLQKADAAPASCRDYEAPPSQLSLPDREILIRFGSTADRITEQLAASQRYIAELHVICSE
jgi:hypothetical protein